MWREAGFRLVGTSHAPQLQPQAQQQHHQSCFHNRGEDPSKTDTKTQGLRILTNQTGCQLWYLRWLPNFTSTHLPCVLTDCESASWHLQQGEGPSQWLWNLCECLFTASNILKTSLCGLLSWPWVASSLQCVSPVTAGDMDTLGHTFRYLDI